MAAEPAVVTSSSSSSTIAEWLDDTFIDRGKLWIGILKPRELSETAKQSYLTLLQQKSSCSSAISKDVPRTLPHHPLFNPPQTGQQILYNVLHAYSLHDAGVGYSQGLSYIVAHLMLHIPDEETVFWCFCRMMIERKYNLRHFFIDNCSNLNDVMLSFEVALARSLPKLAAHLKRFDLEPSLYASHWFISAYSYNFPLAFTVAAWQRFLTDGQPVLNTIALELITSSAEDLLRCSFDGCILLLTQLSRSPPGYPSDEPIRGPPSAAVAAKPRPDTSASSSSSSSSASDSPLVSLSSTGASPSSASPSTPPSPMESSRSAGSIGTNITRSGSTGAAGSPSLSSTSASSSSSSSALMTFFAPFSFVQRLVPSLLQRRAKKQLQSPPPIASSPPSSSSPLSVPSAPSSGTLSVSSVSSSMSASSSSSSSSSSSLSSSSSSGVRFVRSTEFLYQREVDVGSGSEWIGESGWSANSSPASEPSSLEAEPSDPWIEISTATDFTPSSTASVATVAPSQPPPSDLRSWHRIDASPTSAVSSTVTQVPSSPTLSSSSSPVPSSSSSSTSSHNSVMTSPSRVPGEPLARGRVFASTLREFTSSLARSSSSAIGTALSSSASTVESVDPPPISLGGRSVGPSIMVGGVGQTSREQQAKANGRSVVIRSRSRSPAASSSTSSNSHIKR